jgi:uncharacterized protein YegJ (DUF2314 family)
MAGWFRSFLERSGLLNPDPVEQFAGDDTAMAEARRQAQAGLADYWARFEAPATDEEGFIVKVSLPWGEAYETVWAAPRTRAANLVTIELINRPQNRAHHLGQVLDVFESDIVDWAFRRAGILQGGFSERLMLDRMPPKLAAAKRADYGW